MEQTTIPGFVTTPTEMYHSYGGLVGFFASTFQRTFGLVLSHEDLVQELWCYLMGRDALGSFTKYYLSTHPEPKASEADMMFKGYIKRAIMNWCWNYRRDSCRRNQRLSQVDAKSLRLDTIADPGSTPEDHLIYARNLTTLRQACEEAEIRQTLGYSDACVADRFNRRAQPLGEALGTKQVAKVVERWAEIEDLEQVKVRALG